MTYYSNNAAVNFIHMYARSVNYTVYETGRYQCHLSEMARYGSYRHMDI